MLRLGSFDIEADTTEYPEYCWISLLLLSLTLVLLFCVPVVRVLGEAKQNKNKKRKKKVYNEVARDCL